MESIVERIKYAFSRATDRVAGRYIPIHKEPGRLENLNDRALSKAAVDIYENDEHVLIRADMPGANTDNTWVQIDEHRALTFYTRNDSGSEQTTRLLSHDGSPTDWYRVFRLPEYLERALDQSIPILAHVEILPSSRTSRCCMYDGVNAAPAVPQTLQVSGFFRFSK